MNIIEEEGGIDESADSNEDVQYMEEPMGGMDDASTSGSVDVVFSQDSAAQAEQSVVAAVVIQPVAGEQSASPLPDAANNTQVIPAAAAPVNEQPLPTAAQPVVPARRAPLGVRKSAVAASTDKVKDTPPKSPPPPLPASSGKPAAQPVENQPPAAAAATAPALIPPMSSSPSILVQVNTADGQGNTLETGKAPPPKADAVPKGEKPEGEKPNRRTKTPDEERAEKVRAAGAGVMDGPPAPKEKKVKDKGKASTEKPAAAPAAEPSKTEAKTESVKPPEDKKPVWLYALGALLAAMVIAGLGLWLKEVVHEVAPGAKSEATATATAPPAPLSLSPGECKTVTPALFKLVNPEDPTDYLYKGKPDTSKPYVKCKKSDVTPGRRPGSLNVSKCRVCAPG